MVNIVGERGNVVANINNYSLSTKIIITLLTYHPTYQSMFQVWFGTSHFQINVVLWPKCYIMQSQCIFSDFSLLDGTNANQSKSRKQTKKERQCKQFFSLLIQPIKHCLEYIENYFSISYFKLQIHCRRKQFKLMILLCLSIYLPTYLSFIYHLFLIISLSLFLKVTPKQILFILIKGTFQWAISIYNIKFLFQIQFKLLSNKKEKNVHNINAEYNLWYFFSCW